MTLPSYRRVLFLCTGNSARSIMAEALLNARGAGRYRAYSAGSHPTGVVNPRALTHLQAFGVPTADLRSKSWDEFAAAGAPAFDIVITVCDAAAAESCPLWPGVPVVAHWGLPDPAAVTASDLEAEAAFQRAFDTLARRVDALLELPIAVLDPYALRGALDGIGHR